MQKASNEKKKNLKTGAIKIFLLLLIDFFLLAINCFSSSHSSPSNNFFNLHANVFVYLK